jgi:ABC-type Zn2+ transport system substrate-binding protein/surface adhesin
MKKLIFFGVLGLFILASCNSTVTHTHNEHDHEAEGHNHATEDHDHSAHGDESGERHSHETAGSHLETAEAHSDEIILPKVKAEAAGVKLLSNRSLKPVDKYLLLRGTNRLP